MRFLLPVLRAFNTQPVGATGPITRYIEEASDTYILGGENLAAYAQIKFQSGPIKEHGVNGVQVDDLIALCVHRVESLNQGQYVDPYNDDTLEYLNLALKSQEKRRAAREARGVEGTSQA